MKQSAFLPAMCAVGVLTVLSAWADTLTYYPNGETAEAPYLWTTAANWGTSAKTPSLLDPVRVPGSADTVYLTANQLATAPLQVKDGDDITVASLLLAAGDNDGDAPKALYGKGQGTWLQLLGGSLTVSDAFTMADHNYNYGRLEILGGRLSVGGAMKIAVNPYAEEPTVLTVAEGAELDVAGLLSVGNRSQRSDVALTNSGTVVANDLQLGPNSSSYVCQNAAFVNYGTLVVSNNVMLAPQAKSASYATLFLKEGSTIDFAGAETHQISFGGANGYGTLDTEIDLDFTAGNCSLDFSKAGYGYLVGRKQACVKAPSMNFPAVQNGKAVVELHDQAVLEVPELTNPYAATLSEIDLYDSSVVTGVTRLAFGYPVGSRYKAQVSISLHDDSSIVMDPESEATIFGGSQKDGRMDVELSDRSSIRNVKVLQIAAGTVSDSANSSSLGGSLAFRGGTIAFVPSDASFLRLGVSATTNGLVLCGYGTITRTDADEPDSEKSVDLSIPSPTSWAVVADGEGVARELDLRAIAKANDKATYTNKSGTNGWYAVNKGKLVYPRAYPTGWDSKNAIRGVGDYPLLGNAGVPKYVNSFTVSFPSAMGDEFGYLYAEQYATDREDIPAGLPGELPEDRLAVVRLGVNSAAGGWTADDPADPIDFGSVTVNYCYPTNAIREAASKVVVYRHPGTADGHWTKVARAASKDAGTVKISSLAPVDGATWNVGWLAVVAEEKKGMLLIFR